MAGKFLVFTYYQAALLAVDLPYKLAAARRSGEERRIETHATGSHAIKYMECDAPLVKTPARQRKTRRVKAGKHPSRKAGPRSSTRA